MGRPAKAINGNSMKMSLAERKKRTEMEEMLRGKNDKLIPPLYLSKSQMDIFNNITEELNASNILGNLDLYILAQTSICIDRLQQIERQINGNPGLLSDSKFMASKDKYSRDFFRCCTELCMSPQSRAKLSISTAKPGEEKKKTLMDILNEEDDEDE